MKETIGIICDHCRMCAGGNDSGFEAPRRRLERLSWKGREAGWIRNAPRLPRSTQAEVTTRP
jgi:hypothetical protein